MGLNPFAGGWGAPSDLAPRITQGLVAGLGKGGFSVNNALASFVQAPQPVAAAMGARQTANVSKEDQVPTGTVGWFAQNKRLLLVVAGLFAAVLVLASLIRRRK